MVERQHGMAKQKFSVLILAAGKATRFKSERSKLLHRLLGRPLGEYVLGAALAAEPERAYLVIGHDAQSVRATFARPGLTFIEQKEQLGTGHALIVARPELERCPSPALLTLVGDAPLLRPETLRHLVATHAKAQATASVLTVRLEDPRGYGRVVRAGSGRASGGRVRAIVEEKVATVAQRRIQEISSGILCFSLPKLLEHLGELSSKNAQSEYLLTDMVEILNRHREKVIAVVAPDAREVLGVNNRAELAGMEKVLRLEKLAALMRDGVTVVDPEATYVERDVEVGSDTVLEPGVSLLGTTRVGRDCYLQHYSSIRDSTLGERVTVRPWSLIIGCEVGPDAVIGPFAHLRDGAIIAATARIGNFVEVKKSRVGRGTKALHLTYLGDATLGEKVNIGAGTVTCNYDGQKKNPTVIEDGSFVGSGTMLVAPVRVGQEAYIAAGSTITEDVPPESLAIGRARQVNKIGYAKGRPPAARPLSVTPREVGGVTVLDISGQLTMGQTAQELRRKIDENVQNGSKHIVLNLAGMVAIDSAGLGGLAAAMTTVRSSGGRLKLCGIREPVLRVFESTNLSRAFEIYPHESAALASLRDAP